MKVKLNPRYLLFVILFFSFIFVFTNCSPTVYQVKKEIDVKIPMRDGVELAANIVRPDAQGKFPVLLVRTPYGKGEPENEWGFDYATKGYVYMIQECRGTGNSNGEWVPGMNETKDGLDTHNWILKQPWCNGSIGTTGGSYLGGTQWMCAPEAGDYLKAMFTIVPLIDWYTENAYPGGAFSMGLFFTWGTEMVNPRHGEGAGIDWDNWDWDEAYRKLPLSRWDENIGYKVQWMRDWIAHPVFDEYWAQASVLDQFDQIRAPNITISGWYDIFIKQALEYVPALREKAATETARNHQHLIIGPWAHGVGEDAGDRDFGENSYFDIEQLEHKWFDYWLKGKRTDVLELPPLKIFVMGRNEWRDEKEWPLARTTYVPYYFHSDGSANSLTGDGRLNAEKSETESVDKYVYNPDDPVPTLGGCILFSEKLGPFDHSEIEKRQDVLVYSSDTLREELEVTGPVKVILYASSDARDTDWTAKLLDVYPDGRAFNLCDGIIRARYRDPDGDVSLIQPGQVYQYRIDLWATSNVFLPGHQIRVEISSCNFPRFDRNPNTGNEFGADAKLKRAKQTVYHDKSYPSHILLPVIKN